MTESTWKPDRQRVDAGLARTAQAHARMPRCVLCGQRARSLDQHGLCSKTTDAHENYRAGKRQGALA